MSNEAVQRTAKVVVGFLDEEDELNEIGRAHV